RNTAVSSYLPGLFLGRLSVSRREHLDHPVLSDLLRAIGVIALHDYPAAVQSDNLPGAQPTARGPVGHRLFQPEISANIDHAPVGTQQTRLPNYALRLVGGARPEVSQHVFCNLGLCARRSEKRATDNLSLRGSSDTQVRTGVVDMQLCLHGYPLCCCRPG